jgi:hypothetical protein
MQSVVPRSMKLVTSRISVPRLDAVDLLDRTPVALGAVVRGSHNLEVPRNMKATHVNALDWLDVVNMVGDSSTNGLISGSGVEPAYLVTINP